MDCEFEGCTKTGTVTGTHSGLLLCRGHYQQDWSGRTLRPLRNYKRLHHDENGRVCTTCKEYKAWDEFYVVSGTIGGINGRRSMCKVCLRRDWRERQAARAE